MNGYRTRIFEMHDKPGGLCTSWRRGDYTIDGSIQWLVGSNPASGFYRVWEELGAAQGWEMICPEEYMRVEVSGGNTLTVHADLAKTVEDLTALAPEDKGLIDEFAKGVKAFSLLNIPLKRAAETRSLMDNIALVPVVLRHARDLKKWGGISIGDFGRRFKSEALGEAFTLLWFPEFNMSFLLAALGWMHRGLCGYPLGGSLAFATAIEERYRLLGGEVHYRRRVKRILVEEGRAVGVELDDGTEERADRVISAADGRSTIFGMLEGKYADDEIKGYYDRLAIVPSVIQVSLGVNGRFEDVPCSAMGLNLRLEEPQDIAGSERNHLLVHLYGHDPQLAPEGKTLLKVTLPSQFSYWEGLLEDPHEYDEVKKEIGEKIVSYLDDRFPGLAAQVEMMDIATPITYNRYTGNWQGSISGWMISPESWRLNIRRTLPGLEGFFMAGQWVDPIGVPMAALSGRSAIQLLCKRDGRRFGATVP
jgi:phytoene dehydrogenase-like protein